MPTAYIYAVQGNISEQAILNLSHFAAIILIAFTDVPAVQLRTHQNSATDGKHHHDDPLMSYREAIVLLILATVVLGVMAELLVHSISDAATELNLKPLFIGVILLPYSAMQPNISLP